MWSFSALLSMYGNDSSHFWRPHAMWDEPRFAQKKLRTFAFSIAQGTAHESRNSKGVRVPLFDLFGPHKLHHLISNVSKLDHKSRLRTILEELNALPDFPRFGELSFNGCFEIVEVYLDAYQNFDKGFFAHLDIPVRSFRLNRFSMADRSPFDREDPGALSVPWQNFLQEFSAILDTHHRQIGRFKYTALGDTTMSLGWALQSDVTQTLDFVDAMIKIGLLMPTGRETPLEHPFQIPTGYNGHFAFASTIDCSLGLFDWFTFGAHGANLAFLNTTKNVVLPTDRRQQGLILLEEGCARIATRPLWVVGGFIKADHVVQGFSFLVAYSYEHKGRTTIHPERCIVVNNQNPLLLGFSQHVLNIVLEYDFSSDRSSIGPRLGLFFNRSLAGKRVFITPMMGSYLGIDVRWEF